jgi:hypothetical protein
MGKRCFPGSLLHSILLELLFNFTNVGDFLLVLKIVGRKLHCEFVVQIEKVR